jgi:spore coat protein U-like protein
MKIKNLLLTMAMMLSISPFIAGSADAFTRTSTLEVDAVVISSCEVTTTPIHFGNYDGMADINVSGSVDVRCNTGINYDIALDSGANYQNLTRNISNGTDVIPYELTIPATGAEWGDMSYGNTYPWGDVVNNTGTGIAQTNTVNARLMGGHDVSLGAYNDTVNVTLHF